MRRFFPSPVKFEGWTSLFVFLLVVGQSDRGRCCVLGPIVDVEQSSHVIGFCGIEWRGFERGGVSFGNGCFEFTPWSMGWMILDFCRGACFANELKVLHGCFQLFDAFIHT